MSSIKSETSNGVSKRTIDGMTGDTLKSIDPMHLVSRADPERLDVPQRKMVCSIVPLNGVHSSIPTAFPLTSFSLGDQPALPTPPFYQTRFLEDRIAFDVSSKHSLSPVSSDSIRLGVPLITLHGCRTFILWSSVAPLDTPSVNLSS